MKIRPSALATSAAMILPACIILHHHRHLPRPTLTVGGASIQQKTPPRAVVKIGKPWRATLKNGKVTEEK